MTIYRRRIAGLNDEQVMHAMGIDDAYHVERVLAHGRNGVTERVTIEGAGPFIRKKIPGERANRAVWAALALSTCARLPQVIATYEMPDCFATVYDDVPGESLLSVVDRAGALPVQDSLQLARDLCEAVSSLHACGVMHLDISPANVIVAADGAHLIDLGNAQMIEAQSDVAKSHGRPRGTWGFAAPEQFFSKPEPRSDIYALGRVLGYMVTGVSPDEDNLAAYESALANESTVPARVRRVVERATGFGPNERYETADRLARALDACADSPEDAGSGASVEFQGAGMDGPSDSSLSEGPLSQVASSRRKGVSRAFAMGVIAMLAVTLCIMGLIYLRATSQKNDFHGLSDSSVGNGANALSMAGDSSNGDDPSSSLYASQDEIERAYESLEIVESGWKVVDSGYVMYALTLENTSDDLTVDYPEIIITGRDESGSVVFSTSQVLKTVHPGQRLTYGCQAGNGTVPATVEFSVIRPQDYQVSSRGGVAEEFEVSNVAADKLSDGLTSFTGEVTFVDDGSAGERPSEIWLSLVLRNDAGEIIYGENGFVACPVEGETAPFELGVYDCPSYATAEVVAMAW